MQEDYSKAYDDLKAVTQGFLVSAIEEKIGDIGYKEI